jgi:hypothetical protein
MMARVTLSHTGRPLQVSPMMTVAFVAITASGVLRVFGPLFRADLTRSVLVASVVCWSIAFALHVLGNARVLLTPRPDGKVGKFPIRDRKFLSFAFRRTRCLGSVRTPRRPVLKSATDSENNVLVAN